jgi:hypothetical protein
MKEARAFEEETEFPQEVPKHFQTGDIDHGNA